MRIRTPSQGSILMMYVCAYVRTYMRTYVRTCVRTYMSVTLRNVAVTSRRNVANQRSNVIIIARNKYDIYIGINTTYIRNKYVVVKYRGSTEMAEHATRGKGQCCRCNGRGTCRNCVCAKYSRPCKNCAPGRSMKCRNPYAEECQSGETTGMITDSQAACLQASLDETLGGSQEPVMDSMHIGTRPTDLAW